MIQGVPTVSLNVPPLFQKTPELTRVSGRLSGYLISYQNRDGPLDTRPSSREMKHRYTGVRSTKGRDPNEEWRVDWGTTRVAPTGSQKLHPL